MASIMINCNFTPNNLGLRNQPKNFSDLETLRTDFAMKNEIKATEIKNTGSNNIFPGKPSVIPKIFFPAYFQNNSRTATWTKNTKKEYFENLFTTEFPNPLYSKK